ncbi:MAG: hypothetical protein ACI4MQ_05565 [Candidatus Coproplasma sp.]
MGLFLGKYFIYLKFKDGTSGYFMHKDGDHLMVCDSVPNAEKFMTYNGAVNYFHNNGLAYGSNSNFSPLADAWIYTDGKYFRMD